MENILQSLIRAEHILVYILWARILQKIYLLFKQRNLETPREKVRLLHTRSANTEGYTEKQPEV